MVSDLLNDYSNRFTGVKMHVNNDGYEIAWGQDRLNNFHGIAGDVPTLILDGWRHCPPDDYRYCLEQQLNEPTDVTIQLSADQVSGAAWNIHATVCVEASGASKTMRVQIAPTLDDYPNPPSYSRNCLMQDVLASDITVAAGACTTTVTRVTFDAISQSRMDDVRIIAWTETPAFSGPANVFQAAVMAWPFPAAPVLTTISIDPAAVEVQNGDQQNFAATGADQYGGSYALVNPNWSLSGECNGTLNPASGSPTTGFTASSPGSCVLSCSDNGVTGSASITVTGDPPQLANISILPSIGELDVGQQVLLTASGTDQYGADFPLTSLIWSKDGGGDGDLIPPAGTATPYFYATVPGTCTVSCEQDEIAGTAVFEINGDPAVLTSIEVSPATSEIAVDGHISFVATGRDQYGNLLTLENPIWSVFGTGDGNIDPAHGSSSPIFTATYPGACQVSVSQGGVSGSAEVVIIGDAPALAAITISPSSAELALFDQMVFTATGTDQYGYEIELADPAWTIDGNGEGSFDPVNGSTTTTFTASAEGSAQMSCSSGGIDGSAVIEIVLRRLPAPRRATSRHRPSAQ